MLHQTFHRTLPLVLPADDLTRTTALSACSWPLLFGVWALLVSPTLQDTVYSANGTLAVHSIAPCHLYGDGDLYGRGVRWSFYIQFIAGTFGDIWGLKEELRALRIGFNIIIFAVLVATILSTNRGSLAALEWYLVSSIVLILPFYVSWPLRFGFIKKAEWKEAWIQRSKQELPTWKTFWKGWLKALIWKSMAKALRSKVRLPIFGSFIEAGNEKEYAKDYLSMGLLLLLYTVYLALQPWLYFMRAYQGYKTGCAVRIYVVYRYVDVHGHKWVILMRIGAVLAILFALYTLKKSVLYIRRGVHNWLKEMREKEREKLVADLERNDEEREEPARPRSKFSEENCLQH